MSDLMFGYGLALFSLHSLGGRRLRIYIDLLLQVMRVVTKLDPSS